ncbi:hypothetical protein Nepgr_020954 [Nepenthes gracilis]|uniref:Uncharacterized protein n=1 Tax=Nepenthes gracilis TaxID=150966 RepID=A0AAD3SW17_NEPGR|nr:hypothetical protein Nepgr_020954 [Nepenthes gracilis]
MEAMGSVAPVDLADGELIRRQRTWFIIQVMHVLGFDRHAFAHFQDERKRQRSQLASRPTAQWEICA